MKNKMLIPCVAAVLACIAWAGYWLVLPLFTEVVVSEAPLVEMSSTVLERQGAFAGFDRIHNGTGTASVYLMSGEEGSTRRVLRFEEGFQVNNGPDLYVGFGKDGKYVKGSEISKLKGTVGSQNYEIPEGVDLDQYDSVYVWCKAFSTPFIRAGLIRVPGI